MITLEKPMLSKCLHYLRAKLCSGYFEIMKEVLLRCPGVGTNVNKRKITPAIIKRLPINLPNPSINIVSHLRKGSLLYFICPAGSYISCLFLTNGAHGRHLTVNCTTRFNYVRGYSDTPQSFLTLKENVRCVDR